MEDEETNKSEKKRWERENEFVRLMISNWDACATRLRIVAASNAILSSKRVLIVELEPLSRLLRNKTSTR